MLAFAEVVRPTTFIEPQKLRDKLGVDITIASETFQHTGSFKFRAAYNLVSKVPNEELFTASSGNFGQALAYASKLLGKKCTVVMPETSAQVKIDAVRSYGAVVDLVDIRTISRNNRIAQLSTEMPAAYVASPYDDALVIEGNATLGDEICRKEFDVILAPVGGGGMISGMVTAVRRNNSKVTIADGARTISVGKLNWPIIKEGVSEIVEVSDENICEAVRLYFGLANLKC